MDHKKLLSRTWIGGRHMLGEARGDPLDIGPEDLERLATRPEPEVKTNPLEPWKGVEVGLRKEHAKRKKKAKKKREKEKAKGKKGKDLTEVPNLPKFVELRKERAVGTLRQEMATYMTPSELAKYEAAQSDGIENLINQFRDIQQEVVKAAALAGIKKRGWYAQSAETIFKLFGHDSDDSARFCALLAALSPQNDVRTNLIMALKVWNTWEDGLKHPETDEVLVPPRTDNPEHFDAVMGGLKMLGFKDAPAGGLSTSQVKNFDAWTNNVPTVLAHPDGFLGHEREKVLSGFEEDEPYEETPVLPTNKIENFRRNLLGDLHRVTLDTWMEYMGRLMPGKTTGDTEYPYHGYAAAVRKVADELGWHPAEVQETSWTTIKALMDGEDKATITQSGAFKEPNHEIDALYRIEDKIDEINNNKNLSDEAKSKLRTSLRAKSFSKAPSARIRDVIGGHLYGFDEESARKSGMDEEEIESKKNEARERLGGIGVNIEDVNAFDEFLSFSPTFHELVAEDPEVKKHAEAVTKRYERLGGGRKKRGGKDRPAPRATGTGSSPGTPSRKTGDNLQALGRLGLTGDEGLRMRASNIIYSSKPSKRTKRVQSPRSVSPVRDLTMAEIKRKATWQLYHGLPPEAIYKAIQDHTITTMAEYVEKSENQGKKKTKTNPRFTDHQSVSFVLSPHHPSLQDMQAETKRISDWLSQAAQDRMRLIEYLQEMEKASRQGRSLADGPPEPKSAEKIPTVDIVLLITADRWLNASKVLYIVEKQLGSGSYKFVVHAPTIDEHGASETHAAWLEPTLASVPERTKKRQAAAEKAAAKAAQEPQEPLPEPEPQQPQEPQEIPRDPVELPAKTKMVRRPGTRD